MVADASGAVRGRLRRLRSAIDAAEQVERSRRVANLAPTLPRWSSGGRVALYCATNGELDVAGIATAAREAGIATYVPIIAGEALEFGRFDDDTLWAPNHFGIPEPVDTEVVAASDLDLVLVPAVAVDPRGNRLGMGAGYYDRTFEWLGSSARPSVPVLVAVVHREQVLDTVEHREWDVPVDAILTPDGVVLRRD